MTRNAPVDQWRGDVVNGEQAENDRGVSVGPDRPDRKGLVAATDEHHGVLPRGVAEQDRATEHQYVVGLSAGPLDRARRRW